ALRNVVDEAHSFGALEVRQSLATKRDDLIFSRFVTCFENHKGCYFLTIQRIWNPYRGGSSDCRMLVEDFVYLARVDVLSSADDHVALAIDDIEKTVRVSIADVAGMKPTITKC